MRLVYAIPLLIALGFLWLAARYMREQRRERRLRERLNRTSVAPKFKSRGDTERSEMRAGEDATTVMRAINRKAKATAAQSHTRRGAGGRSSTKS